jgi:hypothetical protein
MRILNLRGGPKEKHGVWWDPMPELTNDYRIASPYHIYHGQPYAGVDLNPKPESTLSRCQGLRIWPQISGTTLSWCSGQCCGAGMICPDLAFQGRAGSGS